MDVMMEIQLEDDFIQRTKVFINYFTEDTSSMGCYSLRQGFLLGLPNIMNFHSTSDVPIQKMSELDKSDAASLEQLAHEFVLSDRAKKFLIARELERGRQQWVLSDAILPSVSTFTSLLILYKSVQSLNLQHLPILLKLISLLAYLCVSYLLYIKIADFRSNRLNKTLDALACQHGLEYALGGVEFYQKSLDRHKSLRALLLLNAGWDLYTLKGELKPKIFRNKLTINERLKNCRDIADELAVNL